MSGPLRLATDLPRAEACHDGLLALMRAAIQGQRSGGGFERVAGLDCYLKYGPLRGSARRRHGLRSWFGVPVPRLREYDNLTWLRANGFGAPRPLAAGALGPRAAPTFQYLATLTVDGAPTLRALCEGSPPAEAHRPLARLGEELARLHGAGFVHGDLFPRNLLVEDPRGTPRILFLDSWRGGPRRSTLLRGDVHPRGTAYDLACLMLFGVELFDDEGQELLLGRYFEGRALSRGARGRILRRAVELRRGLVAQAQRRGRTTPPIPTTDWSPSI